MTQSTAIPVCRSVIFQQNHIFYALVVLKTFVSLKSHLIACSLRIIVDTQADTQADTQNNYHNPHYARVDKRTRQYANGQWLTIASVHLYSALQRLVVA